METLRSAAKAAPWPTAATMHPRYFRDPPYIELERRAAPARAGIGQVGADDLQLESAACGGHRPPIVGSPRASGLRFRVAQSVEPELEPQLSYARRSPQDFPAVDAAVAGDCWRHSRNTDGIVVQAWNDLQRMGHEVRFVKPEASDPNRDRGVEVRMRRASAIWRAGAGT